MSITIAIMNFNLVISPQFKYAELTVSKLVTPWPLEFLLHSWPSL